MHLLVEGVLTGDAQRRIIEAAQSNPLFVEQMLAMLVYDVALVQDEFWHWSVASALRTIVIPPSINALLTAR